MKKLPVWQILVERGLCKDRKDAESWIIMGKVLNDTLRIDKAGEKVDINANITIKGIEQKYVNKGGLKLEGAIKDFNIDLNGKTAIDCGASTGGFTDCLIQNGAELVYAVDVGFGQLAGKLRCNKKIINMEKTNISDEILLSLNPRPQIASIDLSYLSLKKAIPIFAKILKNDGDLLCLVKPLFEVKDSEIRKAGKIDDKELFREIMYDLVEYVNEIGYSVKGITNSPVTGNKGTKEFFLYIGLEKESHLSKKRIKEGTELAIEKSMLQEKFKKK